MLEKNLVTLYDAISTLAEAVGDALNEDKHVQVPLEIPSGDGEKAEEAVTAAMALLEKGSRARTTAANGAFPS